MNTGPAGLPPKGAIKRSVYTILDHTKSGTEFSGSGLARAVKRLTGESLFPATALRYLRYYREERGVVIECISRANSRYRIGRVTP